MTTETVEGPVAASAPAPLRVGAVSFGPVPCVVTDPDGRPWYGVAVGVDMHGNVLVLYQAGGINWASQRAVELKYPPDGPWRLLFGWAEKGQAVNMIFRNCLQEQIDPEELLTVDRTFLLIYLRGISYTPDYEVQIKCPECEAKFPHNINLDRLHLEYCPDDFDQSQLETILPATGFKLRYRMSLGRDEAAIANHRDRRLKQFGENAADDTLLYRASLLIEDIETVNGHRVVGQAIILGILEQLPIKDVAHIRNLMSEPPFGVDTRVDVLCHACSHEFEITLPMEAGFFFPIQRRKTGRRA